MGMTALMGLRTRLALARVALHVPGDRLDVETCASLAEAGVDLLVLGGTGDVDGDVAALVSVRKRLVGRPVLIATSSSSVAASAAADVVHLRRPGWRFWGYPKGHAWGLLGRPAADPAVIESPGEDFDYLFVGPLTDVDGLSGRAAHSIWRAAPALRAPQPSCLRWRAARWRWRCRR